MTHPEKVDRLIAELGSRGVNEYTTAPPAWRAAWALGLKVPPPHFLGFAPMAITCGLFFGVLWGAAMHFMLWNSMGWLFSAVAGVAAGICSESRWRGSTGVRP